MTAREATQAWRDALYHDFAGAASATGWAADAKVRLCYPFEDLQGWEGLWDAALGPLAAAMPDGERRETIVIAGTDEDGAEWLGCCGAYVGTLTGRFLDIPATGRVAHMRFHEFFRIEDSQVVEMQAVWDVSELMMQAGAWPLAPALGREWHVPGPAVGGLGPHAGDGLVARDHIVEMLKTMNKHPSQGGPEVMELDRFWHPKFMWYGPAGIGTGRGQDGFRRFHQIPFLAAMPDRGQRPEACNNHCFAEGDFVGDTGWPNMCQTVSADGWLGIAPSDQLITLRSLDFWRLEDGLIRENWVLIDMLSIYAQLGVDVLARMRQLTS